MRTGIVLILSALLVVSGVWGFLQRQEATAAVEKYTKVEQKWKQTENERKDLQGKLEAKENNTEGNVKQAVSSFLEAFYTYDRGKGETFMSGIEPYTTENARGMLQPAGPSKAEPTSPDRSIISSLREQVLYYTPVQADTANVFAKVKQDVTVQGVTATNEMLLELKLMYKDGKWLVDEIKPMDMQ